MLETAKRKEFGVPGMKGGGQKNHPALRQGGGRELAKEARKRRLGGCREEQVGGGQ